MVRKSNAQAVNPSAQSGQPRIQESALEPKLLPLEVENELLKEQVRWLRELVMALVARVNQPEK